LIYRGIEHRSVGEALLAHHEYLDQSRYAMQIEQYLKHFTNDQLLVVLSEHLVSKRPATLRRILIADRRANLPPEVTGEVPVEVRAQLQDLLRDDVRALRSHIGPDFDGWGIA
jgi:hypothetical protein